MDPKLMDDNKLFTVAGELNRLTQSYTTGGLKHYQYVAEYDKVLDKYGLTKKQLSTELARRQSAMSHK